MAITLESVAIAIVVMILAIELIIVMVQNKLQLDRHFYKYVLPILLVEFAFWSYAFMSDVRTCQVVLGLVGLWWCLAALWVEVKIEQTYPGFDYEHPTDPEMKNYRPFCDFAPWATCSKVLMSPPGRFLRYFGIAKQGGGEGLINTVRGWIDVPNPALGVLFFGCHLFYNYLVELVTVFPLPEVLHNYAEVALPYVFFAACCFVGCMTVWLAYNLFFVLKDFCVVCVSMYVANFVLIPMMYGICKTDSSLLEGFGAVPPMMLYPFLVLDGIMLVAVLALYFFGHHAEKSSDYKQLPGEAHADTMMGA
jgi:vitamin-K-epoxide reductase (warfarin-sensitive)